MNTIYILWLRQIKRYMRSRSRIFGSLMQPLLFFVALSFGFGPIYSQAGGGNYIQFLAPGIIAMSIMFSSVFSGIDLIWDKQFGFLKETLVAPVSRITIMLGRTLGAATVSFVQGILVLLMTIVFGFRPESLFLLPLAFVFMLLIAFFFTALGTAIASVINDMHAFPIVMNFLVMPLFFLSGALFPLENFPPAIKIVSYANPLSYGVDGLRWAMSGLPAIGPGLDFSVLLIFAFISLASGALLFKKIQI
jgi:ABC-2 type transport system permease protein